MNYHLYRWMTVRGAGLVTRRGKRIASFRLYRELVADAQRRAVAAGYAKSNWMELFDWSHG